MIILRALQRSNYCGFSTPKALRSQTEKIEVGTYTRDNYTNIFTTQAMIMITYNCTIFYFNTERPKYKYDMTPYDYQSNLFKRHGTTGPIRPN